MYKDIQRTKLAKTLDFRTLPENAMILCCKCTGVRGLKHLPLDKDLEIFKCSNCCYCSLSALINRDPMGCILRRIQGSRNHSCHANLLDRDIFFICNRGDNPIVAILSCPNSYALTSHIHYPLLQYQWPLEIMCLFPERSIHLPQKSAEGIVCVFFFIERCLVGLWVRLDRSACPRQSNKKKDNKRTLFHECRILPCSLSLQHLIELLSDLPAKNHDSCFSLVTKGMCSQNWPWHYVEYAS